MPGVSADNNLNKSSAPRKRQRPRSRARKGGQQWSGWEADRPSGSNRGRGQDRGRGCGSRGGGNHPGFSSSQKKRTKPNEGTCQPSPLCSSFDTPGGSTYDLIHRGRSSSLPPILEPERVGQVGRSDCIKRLYDRVHSGSPSGFKETNFHNSGQERSSSLGGGGK